MLPSIFTARGGMQLSPFSVYLSSGYGDTDTSKSAHPCAVNLHEEPKNGMPIYVSCGGREGSG